MCEKTWRSPFHWRPAGKWLPALNRWNAHLRRPCALFRQKCRARLPRRCATRSPGEWAADVRFDASEHWFRCRFRADPAESGEEIILRFGGIATVAEVLLNGEKILQSNSMFASHDVDVSSLVRDQNELLIVCRSLSTAMREKRRQLPAARWKTRVVAEQQLRWFRTTLLGRAPGFAPEPEPVGPWRPVTLRAPPPHCCRRLDPASRVRWHRRESFAFSYECGISRPQRGQWAAGYWWVTRKRPWNSKGLETYITAARSFPSRMCARGGRIRHGRPTLYPLQVKLDLADGSMMMLDDLPVGFRSIERSTTAWPCVSTALPVFCRGVVWTPPDVVSLNASPDVVATPLGVAARRWLQPDSLGRNDDL